MAAATVDIAGELADKWSRLSPDVEVNVPQDMADPLAVSRDDQFGRRVRRPNLVEPTRTVVFRDVEARTATPAVASFR